MTRESHCLYILCLNHIIMLHERHLMRILRSYFVYYHQSRTHLSLIRNSPMKREVEWPEKWQGLCGSASWRSTSPILPRGLRKVRRELAGAPDEACVGVRFQTPRFVLTLVHWISSTRAVLPTSPINLDRRNAKLSRMEFSLGRPVFTRQ